MESLGAMESLDLYLKLSRGCLEAAQKMPSPNFNKEQCGYLVDKLDVVVQIARSLEVTISQHCGLDSSWNVTKWVGIFKLLLCLGKQIEDFIVECSRADWVKAAMTLTDVAEYVSSLGFSLELCKVLLSEGDCATMQHGLTWVEVDTLNKVEVEMVKLKAIVDKEYLLKKVTLELDTSDLAKYLLQRLVSVHPNPTCDEGNILGKLFRWVVSSSPEEKLGRGASASVFKVMWLGTPVAKKTFFGPKNPFFLKEVEILSQLCHPNITSMFCSTMNKKSCSIIMELMDEDLFSLIQRRCGEHSDNPPFSISEAMDLMLQIAEGVNYLHNKRIIHRDLKSMNILVKMVRVAKLDIGYIQAKVVDFGLSKTKERSATNSCMTYNEGTCRWMAPELVKPGVDNPKCVADNEGVLNYKFKCDMFSFAMVCYEILTGNLPFKDESNQMKIKLLISKGERPELPPNCPAMLKALIEECWNGNAKERPTFATICSRLQYLKYMLMRGLKVLPKEVGNLSSLTTLDLGGCSILETLSKEAKNLFSLPTLSWNCKSLEKEDEEDAPSDNQETSKKPMAIIDRDLVAIEIQSSYPMRDSSQVKDWASPERTDQVVFEQGQVDVVDLSSRRLPTSRPQKRRRTAFNQFLQLSHSPGVEDTAREIPARKFNGVRYRPDRKIWVAEMKPPKHKTKQDFGKFKSETEAARAMDAAFHHYGRPDLLNFPYSSLQFLSTRPAAPAGLNEKDKVKFVKEEAKLLLAVIAASSPLRSTHTNSLQTLELPASPRRCPSGPFRSLSEISSPFNCTGPDEVDDVVSPPQPWMLHDSICDISTAGVLTNLETLNSLQNGEQGWDWAEDACPLAAPPNVVNPSAYESPSMWLDSIIRSSPARTYSRSPSPSHFEEEIASALLEHQSI